MNLSALDDARSALASQKKSRLPAFLKGAQLPALAWRDGQPISQDDTLRLIGLLRNEGPDSQDETARALAPFLDPLSANAWSRAVLETWELTTPAAHKWGLFQVRVMANTETLEQLPARHNWGNMASTGGSVRARWYLTVFSEHPSTPAAACLFGLLIEKIDGALHGNARKLLLEMAKQEGLSIDAYLEREGIMGATPTTTLSFVPGETTLEVDGLSWVVGLHRGSLLFTQPQTHRRSSSLPDGASEEDLKRVEGWREEVMAETLRWCAFFLGLADRSHTRSREFLEQNVFKDALGSQLVELVVWTDEAGRVMRLTDESALDAEYEPVELAADAELSLGFIGDLPKAQREAWTEHMVDEEIVLPVDIFSRQFYVDLFARANAAEDTIGKELHERLGDAGYRLGPTEGGGAIYNSYRTYAQYNVRIFLEHSPIDVSEGMILDGELINTMEFKDLFGRTLKPTEVHISVLAEAAIELARMKGISAPELAPL